LKKINKKAQFLDIFLFIIVSFVLVMIAGIFIYIGSTTKTQLHETLGSMDLANTTTGNVTETIDATFGAVSVSYGGLYWITAFIMIAMIFGIWFGYYQVTTKPVFLIPFFFLLIILIVVAVIVSNVYNDHLLIDETLGSTFEGFTASNLILGKLPIWVSVIGGIGAIILFSRLGKEGELLQLR